MEIERGGVDSLREALMVKATFLVGYGLNAWARTRGQRR